MHHINENKERYQLELEYGVPSDYFKYLQD